MLEALLLATAVASAQDGRPAASSSEEPPSAELLEFLGEWSDEEARAFLDEEAGPEAVSRGGSRNDEAENED